VAGNSRQAGQGPARRLARAADAEVNRATSRLLAQRTVLLNETLPRSQSIDDCSISTRLACTTPADGLEPFELDHVGLQGGRANRKRFCAEVGLHAVLAGALVAHDAANWSRAAR